MDPKQARQLIPTLADGEDVGDDRDALNAAIEQFPELQAELERWKALRHAAHRAVFDEPLPPGLETRLRATLHHTAGRRGRVLRLASALTAVAAGIVLLIVFRDSMLRSEVRLGGNAPTTAALVVASDSFVQIHERCAVQREHHGFGAGDDSIEGARHLIEHNLGFDPIIPDLTAAGFRLEGCCGCLGRLVPKIKAAHIYYRETAPQGRMVSFFAINKPVDIPGCRDCPKRTDDRRPYQISTESKVAMLKWTEGDYSYAIVAHMRVGELRQLANRVDVAGLFSSTPMITSTATSRCQTRRQSTTYSNPSTPPVPIVRRATPPPDTTSRSVASCASGIA